MAASEIEQWWIDKFQENLGPIRKVAGWTTQQLADELGVARQTVSNLETGKSPMTKLQYLALRTVFSAEIARREDRDRSAPSHAGCVPRKGMGSNGRILTCVQVSCMSSAVCNGWAGMRSQCRLRPN